MSLIHGGQLDKVAASFGLDNQGWLDLSTGISPFSYPTPAIPSYVWRDLPQPSEPLIQAAKNYYFADCAETSVQIKNQTNLQPKNIMVTNGSQSVIQLLPQLWQQSKPSDTQVWLPKQGYKEHEKAWRDNGFVICHYGSLPKAEQLNKNAILVVVNPNNPTAELVEKAELEKLHHHLIKKSGWLIVDEAFVDIYPQSYSMTSQTHLSNLIVLRSFGKFFGLAGIRIGFIMAEKIWLDNLEKSYGIWQVNAPALYIAEKALADKQWHVKQKKCLADESTKLENLLLSYFAKGIIDRTDLFIRVRTPQAVELYQQLCLQKIYVRLTDDNLALRFGITKENEINRLADALDTIKLDSKERLGILLK